jgi:ABC-type lipoprotein release transport system permease subunit
MGALRRFFQRLVSLCAPLLTLALIASHVPARRAARLDAVVALRQK